mgnify:CR=1 FL=1
MIAADNLKRIAAWSRELNEREIEIARAGIVEKSYRANEFIFMRGDNFDYWTGVVTGLARMGIVSRGGKAASFAGLTGGAWFGEGSVLKKEPRRYDVVALRDTRLAMMDRGTFVWLFENSVGFNRFLVRQLNERLGQFIGLLEYGRTLDATATITDSDAMVPIMPSPSATITRRIAVVDISALVAHQAHSASTTSSSAIGALMMPSHVRCTCIRENAEYMPSKLAVNIALWQTMPVPMNAT